MTWQPIETAPKDGSSILAIWMWGDDNAGSESHAIIYWDCGMWLTISGELPPIPTHWMSLPPAPEKSV